MKKQGFIFGNSFLQNYYQMNHISIKNKNNNE